MPRKDINGPNNTPWQVGDFALCIAPSSRWRHGYGPQPGSINTVSEVTMGKTERGLNFKEFPNYPNKLGFAAVYFIKATPLEEDDFDRETLQLEKTSERKKTKPLAKGVK